MAAVGMKGQKLVHKGDIFSRPRCCEKAFLHHFFGDLMTFLLFALLAGLLPLAEY